MMFAHVDGDRRIARPGLRGQCPGCGSSVAAECGEFRIWHWAHEAADCDPWSEPESDWHLAWKKHAPDDRVEVMIERDGTKHRADVLCHNSAILDLQACPISPAEVQAREAFYKYMAWLFRVTWVDRLHYGKKGFWWKHGQVAQTMATKPVFWDFEAEGIVQEVKLSLADDSHRVLGRAAKTYTRAQFAEFIATGKITAAAASGSG